LDIPGGRIYLREEEWHVRSNSILVVYGVAIYLIVVNIVAVVLYGIDKHKAKAGQWRISEKTLIGVAVIGGSIGAFAGMHLFHHKTKHWYFRFGLPLLLIVQIAAVIVYLIR
jgi:uncharacterized membrane protein YsdA (DUF1294 family)